MILDAEKGAYIDVLDAEKVAYLIDEFDPTPRPTAVALAQTCRSFLEPALNAVWFNLYDILRLLQVMPRDLWRLDKRKGKPPTNRNIISTLVRAIQHPSPDPLLSFTDVLACRYSSAI